jgi:RHS repeat-associated protein
MLVPNRHGSSSAYRYGFQGQEKDDELKGEGNSLNYTFRIHDPRVGRFFATDPLEKEYPWYTPYQFSGNKVIAYIELEGLEEKPSDANSKEVKNKPAQRKVSLDEIKRRLADDAKRTNTKPAPTTQNPKAPTPKQGNKGIGSGFRKIFGWRILIEIFGSGTSDNEKKQLEILSKQRDFDFTTTESYRVTGLDVDALKDLKNKAKSPDGSYTITYENGKKYHGKGPVHRMALSALSRATNENPVKSVHWTPAETERQAYKDEHTRMQTDKDESNPQGYTNEVNYNIRQSPGYNYKLQDGQSVE